MADDIFCTSFIDYNNDRQGGDHPFRLREMSELVSCADRLRKDMYRDFMALDTEEISGGAVTATQIRAQYEPLNSKADEFEYCVIDFIHGILTVAGIDDEPTFTRSMIVNQAEEITNLVSAGEYLDQEYITRRILTVLGDADQVDEVLKRMSEEETIDLTEEEEVNGSSTRSDG